MQGGTSSKEMQGGHANAHFRDAGIMILFGNPFGGVSAFILKQSIVAMIRESRATSAFRQTNPSIPTFPPPGSAMFANGKADVSCRDGYGSARGRAKAKCAAFTRTDLLAVVCVSAVILSSLLAGHSSTQNTSDTIVCMRNVRSLIEGWAKYADDHQGVLTSSRWRVPEGDAPAWEGGAWMDLPISGRDSIDPYHWDSSISQGTIWEYAGSNPATWRCPSDPSTGSHRDYMEGRTVPRVRSYSMNFWMGQPWKDGYVVFKKLSDFALASPGEIFLIVDERYDSINDGSLAVEMTGYDPADMTGGLQNLDAKIVDFPSNYHRNAGVVGFVDGHVESHAWVDARMTPPYKGSELALNIRSPGNRDVSWLQSRATVPLQ